MRNNRWLSNTHSQLLHRHTWGLPRWKTFVLCPGQWRRRSAVPHMPEGNKEERILRNLSLYWSTHFIIKPGLCAGRGSANCKKICDSYNSALPWTWNSLQPCEEPPRQSRHSQHGSEQQAQTSGQPDSIASDKVTLQQSVHAEACLQYINEKIITCIVSEF